MVLCDFQPAADVPHVFQLAIWFVGKFACGPYVGKTQEVSSRFGGMMLRMALPLDQMFFSDFLKKYLKQETDALMFQFLLSALIFHHRLEKSGANLLSNYDATCIFHICSLINVTYRNKWKLMTAWHKNAACKQCLPQPENTYPVNINSSNFN